MEYAGPSRSTTSRPGAGGDASACAAKRPTSAVAIIGIETSADGMRWGKIPAARAGAIAVATFSWK